MYATTMPRSSVPSLKTLIFVFCASTSILTPAVGIIPDATHSHLTPSGQQVLVFDDVIPPKSIATLRGYLMRFSPWEFHETGTGDLPDGKDLAQNLPWTSPIPAAFFKQTCLWKSRMRRIPAVENHFPRQVQAEILRRGDPVQMQNRSDEELSIGKEYSWRVFLTPEWQNNDYGDLTLYEGDLVGRRKTPDPIWTITPRMGRLVLWDATLSSLYHPPSMGYIQGLLSISGKLTITENKHAAVHTDQKKDVEAGSSSSKTSSSFPAQYQEGLDLATKYTRSFKDSRERTVAVYDGVFSADDLSSLRHAVSTRGVITYSPYDIHKAEDVDNTQWIKTFDPEDFAESEAWKVLRDVMKHASGNRTQWHPYDVSLNIVRAADHTRIHQDCDEWEDEYTMVLYLNQDWRPDFYGETAFFESKPCSSSDISSQLYGSSEKTDYQPFAAVLPKYGRLAVFQGNIPHSARPPSALFTGARYTFAVKVSLNRRIALAKRLQETLEDSTVDLSTYDRQLIEELISGDYNREASFRSNDWLEQRLQDARQKAALVRQRQKSSLEGSLFAACD